LSDAETGRRRGSVAPPAGVAGDGNERGEIMSEKKTYGWNGWKMPILHPNDPDYCEYGCPICVPARKGNKLAQTVQKLEMAITFGGCWWGRARQRKYGVAPDQPIGSGTRS
jgi:hypothetical protein